MRKIKVYQTNISKGLNIETFYDVLFIQNDVVDYFVSDILLTDELKPLLNHLQSNDDVNEDIYNWIKNHLISEDKTKSELKNRLDYIEEKLSGVTKNVKEVSFDIKQVIDKLNSVSNNSYNYRDNKVYYKNTKIALPKLLIFKINDNNDIKYIKSLHLFWLNCLNKENYSNIENLFEFIYENGLTITPNGYLFTFRRILTKNSPEDTRLFMFILQTWLDNIKKSKSNDSTYIGYDNTIKEYFYTESKNLPQGLEILGSVSELYDSLKNSDYTIKYTDNHTKKFNYKIGQTYSVQNVDSNINNTCSYGLHLGSKEYVTQNKWLGDTIVGCIVNPADIIAVSDSWSKLRVRKMHIVTIVQDIDSFDSNTFNYDYEKVEVSDILETLEYNFNESYLDREKHQIEKYINELVTEKSKIENEINKYNMIANMDIDSMRDLLNSKFIKNENM